MGKKKKAHRHVANEESAPFHSAFAGLASLRDELPGGPQDEVPADASPDSTPRDHSTPVTLVLQREKKGRSGKTVTRVLGLPTPDDRERWARTLKKELGCGATIDGDDLILLGDVGPRAKARLEAAGFGRVVLGN